MPTYLEGVAVQFYRGIGPETQYIAPFSEMNFFVGANNAGKSVVLNLIKDRLPFGAGSSAEIEANSVEAYRGSASGSFSAAVGLSRATFLKNLEERHKRRFCNMDPYHRKSVYDACDMFICEGYVWLAGQGTNTPFIWGVAQQEGVPFDRNRLSYNQLGSAFGVNLRQVPRDLLSIKALDLLLEPQKQHFPGVLLIPAKRKIDADQIADIDLSGRALVHHLAKLQDPDHGNYEEERALFDKINAFVQEVIGKSDAHLHVPNHREFLQVHIDGKTLPLSSLGTGIHEVILIAAFCTIHQQRIMCIEEPEIHLHPVLQRKLIRYLQDKTENQYFIATHSAAFIDTPGASVFHVRNDGVQTYVTPAIVKGDKRRICDDLGYRASDILQANAVIWVEGPSDRIYIRRWLQEVDPDLHESVHYTIMFYGGGLIKHLSADDDALDDFIRLRDLNRNIAIVLDSDKDGPRAALKPAAKRIRDEMAKVGCIVWITKGREIENYVPHDLLQGALKELHPRIYGSTLTGGPYDHAFYFARKGSKASEVEVYKDGDKVGAATVHCAGDVDLGLLDLRDRIEELAAMIRRANGLGRWVETHLT